MSERNQKTVAQVCGEIQGVESQLFRLRDQYDSTSSVFHALTVAWEACRFAWYAAYGDFNDAMLKLDRVQAAIEWYLANRK